MISPDREFAFCSEEFVNLGLDSQIQLAKNGILIQSRRILFLKNNLEMRSGDGACGERELREAECFCSG